MPTNNPIKQQQANVNECASSALTPLTAAQCTPNFLAQLAQTVEDKNWLSIYPIVSQLIQHFISLPQPLLIFNARHWQAATEVISTVSAPNHQQLALLNYDQEALFGRLNLHPEKEADFYQGEIYKYDNGSLILHISPMLVNPKLWFLLKAFLISHRVPATSAVNGDKLKGQCPLAPTKALSTKIILVASRYQLDELAQIDPEYNQVNSLFTELSSEIRTTDNNIHALQSYCHQ